MSRLQRYSSSALTLRAATKTSRPAYSTAAIHIIHTHPPSLHVRLLSQLTYTTKWRLVQDETDLLLSCSHNSNEDIVHVLSQWQSHPNAPQAARTCQKLLNHWLENTTYITTSEPFLLTMKAWNRCSGESAYKVAHVLEEWVIRLEGDLELAPTREAYHVLLQAFAKEQNVQECTSILEYLERMQSVGNLTLQPPNVETYAHVLHGLTKSSIPTNVEKRWKEIQALLEKLDKDQRRHQHLPHYAYYKVQAYSHVVCFAVQMDKTDQAMRLLHEGINTKECLLACLYWNECLQQEEQDALSATHLVARAYQAVLSKLGKLKQPAHMDALLLRLESLSLDLPWPRHYAMTIQAWSDTCTNNVEDSVILETARHCEELLQRMEERSDSSTILPSLDTYERVLWIFARVRYPAEYLLAHVMNLVQQQKVTIFEPATLTAAWNHVIKSFHLTERPDKVVRLWQRMKEMNVMADATTMTLVLRALSRQPDAARQAEDLLDNDMPEPVEKTAAHYEAVVVAWSRSSEQGAAARAQALLEELEELYGSCVGDSRRRDELRPTVQIYNAVITAHARRKNQAAAQQVLSHMLERANVDPECPLPDSVTFAAILDGLSRQRSKTAARKAEDFLAFMESSESVRPVQSSYTSVMSAIVRSGDWEAPERVMRIYERMLASSKEGEGEELRPDFVTYAILLDMWAKSRRAEGGERAEELLRDMQRNDLNANSMNYNNVILAHARSKKALSFERAEALLREMEKLALTGDETVTPDTVTYTNVIMALKRSCVENKAQVAWDLLQEMTQSWSKGNEDVRPNIITIYAVLTSCAFTRGDNETRRRAVQLALAVFSEMEKLQVTPDSNSFRMLIETFGRQVPDMSERTRMAEVAFQRCRREGLVDSKLVQTLQKFVPPLYEQIASALEIPTQSGHLDEPRKVVDRRKQ